MQKNTSSRNTSSLATIVDTYGEAESSSIRSFNFSIRIRTYRSVHLVHLHHESKQPLPTSVQTHHHLLCVCGRPSSKRSTSPADRATSARSSRICEASSFLLQASFEATIQPPKPLYDLHIIARTTHIHQSQNTPHTLTPPPFLPAHQ